MAKKEIDLSCIEIEPHQPAKKSMIWLHGLGADGNDFVPFVSELNASLIADMRLIFPHAPMMPISLNNGYAMRAWYDIYALALDAKIDVEGISQSISHVEKLIKKESDRGVTANNIFLGGFSQGAAIAIIAGLTHRNLLGGILALSGYLPLSNQLREKIVESQTYPPIFQAHGTLDPIVPYALGKATYEWLKETGHKVSWHTYPIPHTVCTEELDDINQWLSQILK